MIVFFKNEKAKFFFAFIVFLFGLLGIGLEVLRSLGSSDFWGSLFVTFLYFTSQSNLFLTITALLFLTKNKSKLYNYFAFITLINISITGLIFHTFLVQYMADISFIHHVLHTINPLLFIIFYFFFFEQKIKINQFWISLIYPLIFLIITYTIVEPFFGNLLETIVPDLESARYVYPFLDPRNYERETLGVVGFVLGILTPFIVLISLLFAYLKSKINYRYLKIHAKEKA